MPSPRLTGLWTLDVLAGLPPCQGFSTVGFRSKKTRTGYRLGADERNFLFENMICRRPPPEAAPVPDGECTGHAVGESGGPVVPASAARMLEKRGGTGPRSGGSMRRRLACRRSGFAISWLRRVCPHAGLATEEYQDVTRPDLDLDALPSISLQEAIFDLPERGPVPAYPSIAAISRI